MKIFSSLPDSLVKRLQRLFRWLLACAAGLILWQKWLENPVQDEGWQIWQWTAACSLAIIGLLIESMLWWLPARRIASLSPIDALENTLAFLYYQIFISSGLSEWSARYFQFEEEHAKKRSAGVILAVQTSKWIVRLFLSGILLWLIPGIISEDFPARWLAALFILLSALATACLFWPEKLQATLGEKWRAKISAYVAHQEQQGFPVSAVLFLSTLKVALDTVALTILIHPSSPFDMHIFQELYLLCASFHVLAGFLPSLGAADGILRGAAGSFYFIDQPVQLQMAAASIFLLWSFNVALPGSIGGLLQIFRKSYS